MKLPDNDRRRPVREAASQLSSLAGDTSIVTPSEDIVRCRRCRHPLTAARSVELEVGPKCRHLLAEGVAA